MRLPRYVQAFTDRHGHARFYFRRAGFERTALTGLPWSPEFMAALEAAQGKGAAPVQLGAARSQPGSVSAALAAYYLSGHWTDELAQTSRDWRRRVLEKFRAEHGEKRLKMLRVEHMQALVNKQTTPNAQRNFKIAMGGFFVFAQKAMLITSNPLAETVRDKATKGDGHVTWTEDMIAQYRKRHPLGTQARLTMEIMLNLGLRVSDAARVGPRDVVNGWLTDFEPQKTSRSTGMKITAPIAADLAAAIKATKLIGADTYLVNAAGRAHGSVKVLGNNVRDWCDQAGLPDCSSHGLRKACLTRLANLGMDTRTIMGLSGHTSEKEVQTYVDAYNRAKAAERAVTAIDGAHRASDVAARKGNKALSTRGVRVDKKRK